ncbi:MAG TPA: hypothetical protein VGG07_15655 [Solirubrobacteraceae bacterium]
MRLDDADRPLPGATPATESVHRRWVLSKRADDGRPLLVREDRIVHPNAFAARTLRSEAGEAELDSGAPALH